jgi:hypothetical protein
MTIITQVVCNKCGSAGSNSSDDQFAENLYHSFEVQFGFGSDLDDIEWSFDLCDNCIKEIVKSFKIKPKSREIGPYGF